MPWRWWRCAYSTISSSARANRPRSPSTAGCKTWSGPHPPCLGRYAPLSFAAFRGALADCPMSRICQVTGKKPLAGNTVSHANNKRRRRFLPNLHTHRFWLESEKRFVSLRVSKHGLRVIDKKGLDAVVAELRARGEKV